VTTAAPERAPAPIDPARSQRGLVPRAAAGAAGVTALSRQQTAPADAAPAADRPTTAAQARQEALESGNHSYRTAVGEISAFRSAISPPSRPSADFAEECKNSYAASADEHAYVKNRFQWCRNMIAFQNIVDTRGNRTGFMWMDLTVVGYGRDDGVRNVVLFVHPNYVLFGGSYTPTTRFGLGLVCITNEQGCELPADQRLTMAEWEGLSLTGDWVSLTLGSKESESFPTDKVLWHRFGFKATFSDGSNSYNLDYGIRCDSATYFTTNRPKACIFFDVVPHLQYWIHNADGTDSPHKAVAEHIRQAQDQPNTTFPPKPDGSPKVIPGKYTGEVSEATFLERVSSDSQRYRDNVSAKNAACAQLQRPGDDDCDEYPFATTWQGAGLGDGNFSVKYVPLSENRSAGGSLVNYYLDDRILYLENDFFYVQILDRPEEPGGDGRPVVSAGPEGEGNEGEPIKLYGSVHDLSPRLDIHWRWSPVQDVDEGTSCVFSDPTALQPTITCDDDGLFMAELTVSDGVNPPVSAATLVRVHNLPPRVSIASPTPWQVFKVGDQVVLDAPFTDAANDKISTCRVDYDQNGQTVYTWQTTTRSCGGYHIFNRPGMYTIEVQVTDDDGGTGTARVLVIAYDPDGGWTNVNGAIPTPAGALTSNPSATGQTWVHMEAKYHTSTNPPAGHLRAWVTGTGFQLDPTALAWLVVTADGKVAVRGTGTVSGVGGYQFLLYGYDGCQGITTTCQPGADRIRLVVWSGSDRPALYDNARSDEYDIDRITLTNLTSGVVQTH
jgi:hypothetical protein